MGNSRASKNLLKTGSAKWSYIKKDIREKGTTGLTDYDKKEIVVDTKDSKEKVKDDAFSNKESTVINTLVHETLHKNHPKMYEKTVRKEARKLVSGMGKKAKSKLYSKLS